MPWDQSVIFVAPGHCFTYVKAVIDGMACSFSLGEEYASIVFEACKVASIRGRSSGYSQALYLMRGIIRWIPVQAYPA
jgi:hypothetical protein